MKRLQRPLDQAIVARIDEQLYAAHKSDPQPNPLFDAQGNRRKLDPNDPAQADVQQEWCSHYTLEVTKSKEGTTPKFTNTVQASSHRSPDDAVFPCTIKHWLSIRLAVLSNQKARLHGSGVDNQPTYAGEKYTASGACGAKKGVLDGGSSLLFQNIQEGNCTVVFADFYEDIEAFFKKHSGES